MALFVRDNRILWSNYDISGQISVKFRHSRSFPAMSGLKAHSSCCSEFGTVVFIITFAFDLVYVL